MIRSGDSAAQSVPDVSGKGSRRKKGSERPAQSSNGIRTNGLMLVRVSSSRRGVGRVDKPLPITLWSGHEYHVDNVFFVIHMILTA